MSRISSWRGFDGSCRPLKIGDGSIVARSRTMICQSDSRPGEIEVKLVPEPQRRSYVEHYDSGVIAGGNTVTESMTVSNWFLPSPQQTKSWKDTTRASRQYAA